MDMERREAAQSSCNNDSKKTGQGNIPDSTRISGLSSCHKDGHLSFIKTDSSFEERKKYPTEADKTLHVSTAVSKGKDNTGATKGNEIPDMGKEGSAVLDKEAVSDRYTDSGKPGCEYCHKSFSKKIKLKSYKRIHIGENPYKCKYCKSSFSVLSILRKHMKHHDPEKPHRCDHCPKTFKQKSQLGLHMKIHTGEELYVCEYCGRSILCF